MSAGLRSGQGAEAAGVNVQTLRYYERRGLLAEPERSNGGHRLYGPPAKENRGCQSPRPHPPSRPPGMRGRHGHEGQARGASRAGPAGAAAAAVGGLVATVLRALYRIVTAPDRGVTPPAAEVPASLGENR